MEWETIENSLHDGPFWNFIAKKSNDYPNRIDFLFGLLYKADKLRDVPESDWHKEAALFDRGG